MSTWQCELLTSGANLTELRKTKEALMGAAKAPNTIKAYSHSWKVFSTWCAAAERSPLPASPDTVSLFLTWASQHYKLETIRISISSIRHYHFTAELPNPLNPEVLKVIAGIVRLKAREEGRVEHAGKQRLTPDQLRRICASLLDEDPVHIRDRAIILLMFASAWRRSEMAGLALDDVTLESQGVRLWLAYSKTDQQGTGRETLISYGHSEQTCPVRALERWLEIRGTWRGPLFVRFHPWAGMTHEALSGRSICDSLKRALKRIGEKQEKYGAHSLRSGMITAASEAGASIRSIMDRSGHRSIGTVMRYIKSSGLGFRDNPLKGVL